MYNGIKVISADSHVVERWDLWKERLPEQYQDRAPKLIHDEDGDTLVCEDLPPSKPSAGVLRREGSYRSANSFWDEELAPGYDPDARLPFLDADGIDGEVLFPTTSLAYHAISDVPFKSQMFKAYNEWLAEFCAAYPDRYKGIAMLPHEDVDFAVGELVRAKQSGLVGVMLPTVIGENFQPYHSSTYDPLWRAAADQRMPIHFHAATSADRGAVQTGNANGRNPANLIKRSERVQRVLIELFFGGVFDRHPGLLVISAENNAGWLGDLLTRADFEFHHYNYIPRLGFENESNHEPSYYWRTNCRSTFWNEPAAVQTRNLIGLETLMFQTDFPHGVTTYPDSMKIVDALLADVPEAEQAALLYTNAAAIYGF